MIYDVAVIGGGPGGSTVSRGCSEKGIKTLLLEKEFFPRDKPCGGALSEQAMVSLNFKGDDDLVEKECYGVRVHYKNFVLQEQKDYRLVSLTARSKFDYYLLKKAESSGVDVVEGEEVTSIQYNEELVVIETSNGIYKAKCVVGADGVNSYVAKHVRPPLKHKEMGICLTGKVEKKGNSMDDGFDDVIHVYFGYTKRGYCWVFPHGEYYSVGIGGLLYNSTVTKDLFYEFLQDASLSPPNNIKTHLIPMGGIDRKLVYERTLLVGDAAGFVDSFSGEGISYAILSGEIAAEIIEDAVNRDDFSEPLLAEYEKICYTRFGKKLKHALFLTKLVHNFPDIFFKIMSTKSSALNNYLEVMTGRNSYKNYLCWLIFHTPMLLF